MGEESLTDLDHDIGENVEEIDKDVVRVEPEVAEIGNKAPESYLQFDQVFLNQDYKPRILSSASFETYTRGCKWSPDGLCILSLTDDNRLKIFDAPNADIVVDDFHPAVTMAEAECVYDFQWYPLMDSSRPETCCLATTSQYQPVHLYDAYDGHLRATYRCFNHLDEMVAGRSLAFDPTGSKLFVGLRNEIRIFDVDVPGRDCEVRKTFLKKRKLEEPGLNGIISSIAFNPSLPTVFALATFSRHLGVYMDPLNLLCLNEAQQKGGITHIQFSPDGSKLLAGGRKDKEILVWDLRNLGSLYAVLHREVTTNQRIYFDVSSCGQFVVSGSTDAKVRIWDLNSAPASDADDPVIDPCQVLPGLHSDCVNGVSLHPWRPVLATCSGQRHFEVGVEISDDDADIDGDKLKCSKEFSLKVWNFQKLEQTHSNET